MMGERRVRQDALFYEFSLERHVPERDQLRSIDRFVALDGLRQELAPFYSEMGDAIIQKPTCSTESRKSTHSGNRSEWLNVAESNHQTMKADPCRTQASEGALQHGP